jgi:hypothetical protein
MMKKLLLLSVTVFTLTAVFAQQQRNATYFQKTYKRQTTDPRDSSYYGFDDVVRTADGGYGILGYFETVQNNGDYVVTRMDSLGNVIWTSSFGSDSLESPTGIRATPDGGFVFSGWNADASFSKGDMSVSKVNSSGALQWSAYFGIPESYEEANDLAVLNNSDIVVVGYAPKGFGSAGYVLLIKQNGQPEDGNFISAGTSTILASVDRTSDGGAIVGGYGGIGVQYDPLLVKLNANLQVQWARRYATTGTQFATDVKQTADGGYILGGQHSNGPFQGFYLIKTRANGDTSWIKTYDTRPLANERIRDIVLAPDGYFILGSVSNDTFRTKSFLTGNDTIILYSNPFLMKVDTAGRFLWAKMYGDTAIPDIHYAMTRAANGGLTMVGETFGFGNRYGGGYVTNVDRDGNFGNGVSCRVANLNIVVGSFTSVDSTRFTVINEGQEVPSRVRVQTLTTAISNVCQGVGPNTNTNDVHLPDNAAVLYPNPVQERLTVELPLNTEGVSQVSIFDISGRLLFRQNTPNSVLTVETGNYARGLYLMKVEKDGKFLTKKFIVD